MRIKVRGWGRDLGETEIMNGAISNAPVADEDGSFSRGQVYKKIVYPDDRRRTKVCVSTSAEVRLGGSYLLQVELNRKEIAQLFYETHSGSLVRMVRAFIDEEDNQDRADQFAQIARRNERLKRVIDEMDESETGDNADRQAPNVNVEP